MQAVENDVLVDLVADDDEAVALGDSDKALERLSGEDRTRRIARGVDHEHPGISGEALYLVEVGHVVGLRAEAVAERATAQEGDDHVETGPAGVGDQYSVADPEEHEQSFENRGCAAGRDDHFVNGCLDRVVGVELRDDGLTQRPRAARERVLHLSVLHGLHRGADHVRRRREVGLADLEVETVGRDVCEIHHLSDARSAHRADGVREESGCVRWLPWSAAHAALATRLPISSTTTSHPG